VSQGRVPLKYGKSEKSENNSNASSQEQLFIFLDERSIGEYHDQESAKYNGSGKSENHCGNSDGKQQPSAPLLQLSSAPFYKRREQQREERDKEIPIIIWTRKQPLSTKGTFPASQIIKRRLLVELSVIQMEFVANP
jgi:hypothetical protein